MKNADNIKELFEKSNVDINSTRDLEIQQKVLDIYEKNKPAQSVQIWRIIMRSPVTKLAAAAVIIIAGVVCFQFLSGTSAYAQVVQEIKNARTIVYTLIRQANTGTGDTIKVDVAYKEPGFMRTTTVDGYIAILDANTGKMISIVPQGGYTIGNLKDLKSNDGGPFADIEAMKALPAKADLRLTSKDIDGIECDGYQVTQADLTTTVWLDAKKGDVVQMEFKYASTPV